MGVPPFFEVVGITSTIYSSKLPEQQVLLVPRREGVKGRSGVGAGCLGVLRLSDLDDGFTWRRVVVRTSTVTKVTTIIFYLLCFVKF